MGVSDDVIIVCGQGRDMGECWNCGGFVGAGDGPFEGDTRFCSLECATDFQEVVDRQLATRGGAA